MYFASHGSHYSADELIVASESWITAFEQPNLTCNRLQRKYLLVKQTFVPLRTLISRHTQRWILLVLRHYWVMNSFLITFKARLQPSFFNYMFLSIKGIQNASVCFSIVCIININTQVKSYSIIKTPLVTDLFLFPFSRIAVSYFTCHVHDRTKLGVEKKYKYSQTCWQTVFFCFFAEVFTGALA